MVGEITIPIVQMGDAQCGLWPGLSLKNDLNWPKMLKFPGSTGALCSNLEGFSLRRSVTAEFLLIETILFL